MPDLVIVGSGATNLATIFRNDGGIFTDIGANLTGVIPAALPVTTRSAASATARYTGSGSPAPRFSRRRRWSPPARQRRASAPAP